VLAGFRRGDGLLRVHMDGSGDVDGVQVGVPDERAPLAVPPSRADLTRERFDQVAARATDGDKSLRAAAEEAARRAAFSPEKLHDKGRYVVGTITYSFLAPHPEPKPESTQPLPSPSAAATTATIPAETSSAPKVGGPLAGAELKIPTPDYPADARRNGIKGTVTLVIRVNKAGKVVSWRTLEGEQRLRTPAIRAARAATFSPEKLPGNGDVVGTITYTFKQ